ncbi:Reverse_transcriptase/endonuclease [Hexamita inflata]|uniref:Reverse transcriptase/endonuclease n=1 Tax=Hexamita inflata TaxID=28002 RepID=A0AA86NJ17_9EUKA|nr:Reverse transcriptase/endonuclease [Hexamita inflata]
MRKQYEHSEPDDQNDTYKRMRAERDIQFAMQNGGVSKAMGKALDYHNNTGHSEVPKAEIPRQVGIHFKKQVEPINVPIGSSIQKEQMVDITREEIKRQIEALDDEKSPGPSGIAPLHLKLLLGHFDFIQLITIAFNEIIQLKNIVPYKFDHKFLIKDNNLTRDTNGDLKTRPIACAEQLLNVQCYTALLKEEFKRILQLTQTNMQTKLAANYKLNSKWHKQQKTASPLQTSMSNQPSTAQDTTSQLETQTEIMQVPQHKYIMYATKARWSDHVKDIKVGVSQGCPLAMHLFASVISELIYRINQKQQTKNASWLQSATQMTYQSWSPWKRKRCYQDCYGRIRKTES